MNFDRINFIVYAIPNDYYGSEGSEYLTKDHKDLMVTVIINDVRIGWAQKVDVYDLILCHMSHKPWWGVEGSQNYWSVFRPFTCSCGDAGCAGIWDGIYIKERGYSIEWRAKREDGYGFLPKTFFNFEKSQYKHAFNVLLWEIEELCQEFDLVVDPGHCEEQFVTGWDFLKYVKENSKWPTPSATVT